MKIAGIIKIAVEASYGIGVNGRFQGRADFTLGLESKIPDGAQVQTTVGGTGTSTAVGFDQGPMEPFFSVNQIDAGVQLHLYSELSLKFGIDLFIFHGEADLNFRIPSIRSELVIGYGRNAPPKLPNTTADNSFRKSRDVHQEPRIFYHRRKALHHIRSISQTRHRSHAGFQSETIREVS